MTEPGAPRFTSIRTLGGGGEGRVDLVFDRVREENVAIKRGRSAEPSALLRFKREFRAIERLSHPGLVRLHELGHDAEGLYFTMEAIDGVTLDRYLRDDASQGNEAETERRDYAHFGTPDANTVVKREDFAPPSRVPPPSSIDAPRIALDRLAHVLPQILEALAALHAHGLVHRDLKPGNVMVTREGDVRLLDFGILAEIGARSDFAGTPLFMSPEQFLERELTPASDLYALGAMLFHLVAGRGPFFAEQGLPGLVFQHTSVEAPRLDTFVRAAPPALVDACARLLAKEPAKRPSIAELDATLLPSLGARSIRAAHATLRPGSRTLVGRAPMQRTLADTVERARGGGFSFTVLRGATGVGKTTLAEWVAGEGARAGMTVLRGSGRPTDRVPFNVLDGVIDALAIVLKSREDLEDDEELARLARLASAAFPVLPQLGAPRSTRGSSPRIEVFGAVVSLLAHVASRLGGLVIVLDDLHVGDQDSLALLEETALASPGSIAIVATERDDVGATRVSTWVERTPGITLLEVAPLDDESIARVIASVVDQAGFDVPTQRRIELAARCAGRPFLAEVVGRALLAGGRDDEDAQAALGALVAHASDEGRELLSMLLVGGEPTSIASLARLLGTTTGQIEDLARALEKDGLVRRIADATIDLYHDAVRATVAAETDERAILRAHGAFVRALERDPDATRERPERFVRHLLAVGRTAEAASRALEGARIAASKLAYALAAELYEIALTHGLFRADERLAIVRALALALDHGARYREAARRWSELAEATTGEERIDAALREATSLLGAPEIVAGHARLAKALSDAGEPPLSSKGPGAWWAGLTFLRGPSARPQPPRATVSQSDRERGERDLRIGLLAGYFNPLAGIRFLVRARQRFEAAGAVEEAAQADCTFAYFALFSDGKRRRVPLADRYLASARARLEGRPPLGPEHAELAAFLVIIEGFAALRVGELDRAAPLLDEALAHLEGAALHGSLGHLYALFNRFELDMARQDFAHADVTFRRMIAASRGTGDSALRCQVAIAEMVLRSARGDFAGATTCIDELSAFWPREVPTIQRCLIDLLTPFPRMLTTDCRDARRAMLAAEKAQRPFRLLESVDAGFYAAGAALIEARALLSGDRDASVRRIRKLASIADEAPPFGTTRARRALAYAEEMKKGAEAALPILIAAEEEAARFGQWLDVAIARFQRGKRIGGDEGTALVDAARAEVEARGLTLAWLREDEV